MFFEQFFAVYSGRIQVEYQDDTHLGIVWKKKLLRKLLKETKKIIETSSDGSFAQFLRLSLEVAF